MKVKISARLQRMVISALYQSMDVQLMERLAGRVVRDYDLHARTGIPDHIAINQVDAATVIYEDMLDAGLLRPFVEILVEVDGDGTMDRKRPIKFLPEIVKEIEAFGYKFSKEYGVFIEDEAQRRTKGWGVLRNGIDYEFSFLRLDIVGNTKLVRKYPERVISEAYADVKRIVATSVEKRQGRIWHWEGDGGYAAFYFGAKNAHSTVTGMEVLLELIVYNRFECALEEPLAVRMAVHTGPCQFQSDDKRVQGSSLDRLHEIESDYTEANSLTISPGVYTDLGHKLGEFFEPFETADHSLLYRYRVSFV